MIDILEKVSTTLQVCAPDPRRAPGFQVGIRSAGPGVLHRKQTATGIERPWPGPPPANRHSQYYVPAARPGGSNRHGRAAPSPPNRTRWSVQ